MNVLTPIGVLCFPQLFTPKPRAPGQDAVYQINLVLDALAQKTPQWLEMRKACAQVIDEKWGSGKSQDKAFIAKLRMPWRPCSEKKYDGYDVPGGMFIAPWTNRRPGIVDAQRQEIMVEEDVWAGMLCRATLSPFAYENSGNRGVNFNLNNVQIVGKGARRLDGRKPANEDFPDDQPVPAGVDDSDDDKMPF